MVFSSSHVQMLRVGPKRRLSTKELMLLNCGAEEDFFFHMDHFMNLHIILAQGPC